MSLRRLNGNEPFRWKPRRKYIIMHSRRNSLKKPGGAMIGWLGLAWPAGRGDSAIDGRPIDHAFTHDRCTTLPPFAAHPLLPPPIQSRCIFGHRGQEMATNQRHDLSHHRRSLIADETRHLIP